jgi:hypothetical protein
MSSTQCRTYPSMRPDEGRSETTRSLVLTTLSHQRWLEFQCRTWATITAGPHPLADRIKVDHDPVMYTYKEPLIVHEHPPLRTLRYAGEGCPPGCSWWDIHGDENTVGEVARYAQSIHEIWAAMVDLWHARFGPAEPAWTLARSRS